MYCLNSTDYVDKNKNIIYSDLELFFSTFINKHLHSIKTETMGYPLVNFHYIIEWGGTRVGFSEVSGLSAKHELLEYREGSSPEFSTIKVPGLRKFSNIILKRGSNSGDNDFFKWFGTTGITVERRDITISLLNKEHEPIIVWKIRNAWPIELKYSELNAIKSDILIERLEIAHEGFNIDYL